MTHLLKHLASASVSRNSALVSVAAAMLLGTITAALAQQRSASTNPGQRMTAEEVKRIYAGRTWMWSDGGGYLDPSGAFSAISGRANNASYAKGRWSTDENGRMCFNATWYVRASNKAAETCFGHRKLGGTIYQRKEPSGPWYVFKHVPTRRGDEFSRLRQGDRVSSQVARLETAFSQSR